MISTELDEIASEMRALRIQGGPSEDTHVEQDNLLVEMCRFLADIAGYDIEGILVDYDSTPKWYA